MIIRWISEVPSKIVQIPDYGAVSAGQRPAEPVVSARIQHGPFEMNDGFRPARVRFRSWSGARQEAVSVAATRTPGDAGAPGLAVIVPARGVTGRTGHITPMAASRHHAGYGRAACGGRRLEVDDDERGRQKSRIFCQAAHLSAVRVGFAALPPGAWPTGETRLPERPPPSRDISG